MTTTTNIADCGCGDPTPALTCPAKRELSVPPQVPVLWRVENGDGVWRDHVTARTWKAARDEGATLARQAGRERCEPGQIVAEQVEAT